MILDMVFSHLKKDDIVCIEEFAMEAKFDTNKVSSGCNWAARLATERKAGSFITATPNQLKKFVNVAEWEGTPGSKKKLEVKEVKRRVIAAVESHWGHKPTTDNIADAYVLARIVEAIHNVNNGQALDTYTIYQQDVIEAIIDPEAFKAKKANKPNARRAAKSEPTLF